MQIGTFAFAAPEKLLGLSSNEKSDICELRWQAVQPDLQDGRRMSPCTSQAPAAHTERVAVPCCRLLWRPAARDLHAGDARARAHAGHPVRPPPAACLLHQALCLSVSAQMHVEDGNLHSGCSGTPQAGCLHRHHAGQLSAQHSAWACTLFPHALPVTGSMVADQRAASRVCSHPQPIDAAVQGAR